MAVPNIRLSASVRESEAVRPVVEQANRWLEPIVREAPDSLDVDWDLAENMRTGDLFVNLHLTVPGIQLRPSGIFTVEELRDRTFAEPAFRQLYLAALRFKTNDLIRRNPDVLNRTAVG